MKKKKDREKGKRELQITSGKERPITRLLVVSTSRLDRCRLEALTTYLMCNELPITENKNILYLLKGVRCIYNLDRTGPIPTPIVL
jgi:hypothetical protein